MDIVSIEKFSSSDLTTFAHIATCNIVNIAHSMHNAAADQQIKFCVTVVTGNGQSGLDAECCLNSSVLLAETQQSTDLYIQAHGTIAF